MPLATLLLPPALLAAAAAAAWGLAVAGLRVARPLPAAATWLALAVLVAGWFAGGRTPVELQTPLTAGVGRLGLRLDAAVVLFELAVLGAAAPLLTFQRRTPGQAAVAALAVAAALVSLASGSMVLTAMGLATTATLARVLLSQGDPDAGPRFWLTLTAAWLLLLWTAVLLDVGGGTSVYAAVPVTAMGVPVFASLALAALLCGGVLPWRTWVSDVAARSRPEAGALAVAVLVPLGLYPLARAYGLGAGQLPSPLFNVVLSAAGAAAALGAAVRAQAATSRRAWLAEAVPFAAGIVVLALGLGTPLGLVAALAALLGLALVAGLAPLLPGVHQPVALLGVAVAAGAPPALVFGGWLLSLQAAVEAGPVSAFVGLAGAGAWLLMLAAAARGLRLPREEEEEEEASSPAGAAGLAAAALAAGIALTGVLAYLAIPAAAELVPPPAGRAVQAGVSAAAILGPGSLAVSTASAGWAAALLAGPLVLLGLAAAVLLRALSGRLRAAPPKVIALETAPLPLFQLPLAGLPGRLRAGLGRVQLPDQYRSLFRPAAIQQAVSSGEPWFWAAATIVLAIAVTR
jgi:formate hydrogenlyase subunit 3/multisubunit Na+/H+ antiporter MnhD subunit